MPLIIILLYYICRGFGQQPCCMAGTRESFMNLSDPMEKLVFLIQNISLFLSCNMAAVKNLYNQRTPDQGSIWK